MNFVKDNNLDNYKYIGNKKELTILFTIQELDSFCSFVMSENSNIKMTNLAKLKELFEYIDISKYKGDIVRLNRIKFIIKALDGRLNKKISNRSLLLNYINGGMLEENIIDDNFLELTTAEIEWINETISNILKYSFMYAYIDEVMDICTRFKSNNYNNRKDIVSEFDNITTSIKQEFRRLEFESVNDTGFMLDGSEEMYAYLEDARKKERRDERRIKSGMQGFNDLINGGFASGRVYLLAGTAGTGKSLTMLNLALQIKKYNTIECKDKTKKPCICILTMENSVQETVSRLVEMGTSVGLDSFYDYDSLKRAIDTNDVISFNSGISIYIKYKPNQSVSTDYLYSLYDELDEKGFECIMMIQDHIKRIRPALNRKDIRLDLGEVINDFKAFAVMKDIPVLTCSHVNRDGMKAIEQAENAKKDDVSKALSKTYMGESILMLDNSDVVIILNREFSKENDEKKRKMYMTFNRQKCREKCKMDLTYICQPYCTYNSSKLEEDLYLEEPLYRISLSDTIEMNEKIEKKYINDELKKYQLEIKVKNNILEYIDERNVDKKILKAKEIFHIKDYEDIKDINNEIVIDGAEYDAYYMLKELGYLDTLTDAEEQISDNDINMYGYQINMNNMDQVEIAINNITELRRMQKTKNRLILELREYYRREKERNNIKIYNPNDISKYLTRLNTRLPIKQCIVMYEDDKYLENIDIMKSYDIDNSHILQPVIDFS